MNERAKRLAGHIAGLTAVLAPFAVCVAAGSIRASLWLDEVTYWYYERSLSLRALEMRRPGSEIAPYFLNYFYCDIQRVFHALLGVFGFTIDDGPELYLRLLSILSFAACGVVVYVLAYRDSRSAVWAATAGLAVSSAPILLFYAFEARVTSFAALGVLAWVILLRQAFRNPSSKRLWIVGALLGVFLTHLHLWIVCLFAGVGIATFIRAILIRRWAELRPASAFAIPGAVTVTAESLYVLLTYPPGGEAFALYTPRPAWYLYEKTLQGAFSSGGGVPPILQPVGWLPSLPLIALIATLLVLILQLRRSTDSLIPAGAVLSLAVSIVIGSTYGFLIAPRYQAPLFAALFFSLGLAAGRRTRLLVAVVVMFELLLLPTVVADVAAKGNGKEIASVIDASTPRNRTSVIVQHPLRLSYPDPLHTFVLHFYLDELQPQKTPVRIYELPALRDVTGKEGLRDYFGGGEQLFRESAEAPIEEWESRLRAWPEDHIWLVTPVPAIRIEHVQAQLFRRALAASGFALVRQHSYEFSGYPPTFVSLFVRSDRDDPSAVSELPLQRGADLPPVREARDEDGSARPSGQ